VNDDAKQAASLQRLLGGICTPRHMRRREEAEERKRRRAERRAAKPEATYDAPIEDTAIRYPLLYDRYVMRFSVAECLKRWGIDSRATFHRRLAEERERLIREVQK
jgi:hypothetical protein